MKIKELLEKLSLLDPELDVVLEANGHSHNSLHDRRSHGNMKIAVVKRKCQFSKDMNKYAYIGHMLDASNNWKE